MNQVQLFRETDIPIGAAFLAAIFVEIVLRRSALYEYDAREYDLVC